MDKDYPGSLGDQIIKELNEDNPPSEGTFTNNLPPNLTDPDVDLSKYKPPMTFDTEVKKHPIQFKLEGEALEYDWKCIDDEKFRVYVFPCGCEVEIVAPLYLYVSKSGGHRIFDSEGFSHYIPPGWIHLAWRAKKGEANFRF